MTARVAIYGRHVQIFCIMVFLCVMGWSEHIQIKILHSCHEFRNQNSVLEQDIFQFLDHVVSSYFFIFEAIKI